MKWVAIAGLAFAAPAFAAVEPEAIASDKRVVRIFAECPQGKQDCAKFVDGEPIIVRAKVGNTTRLEFPRGWIVNTLSPSDEHIIRQIVVPRPGNRPGQAPNEGPVEPPDRGKAETESDARCTKTDSLSLCVIRDRFLDVLPSIPQTEQSFPLLLLFRQRGRDDYELNVDFVLSTVDPVAPQAEEAEPEVPTPPTGARIVRTAAGEQAEQNGNGQAEAKPEAPSHFNTVRVGLPLPPNMPAAAPQTPPQRGQRAPARVSAPAPVAAPVVRNNAYEAFGDLR